MSDSPPATETTAARRDWRLAAMLLGFAVLFISFSWQRDFWAPEEDDFAAVTKEMAGRGDWLVPTLAGEPYFEKPPLLYWLGLSARTILPFGEAFSLRVVVMLFGVLGLWVTFVAGSKFLDRRVGFVATAIQGTTVLFFRCSSWYLTDVLFASCVSLALVAFALAMFVEQKRVRWRILGFAGFSGACLAKSPLLATFLIAAPLLVFLVLHRRSALLLLDLGRLRPFVGLLGVAIVVVPWYVVLTAQHGTAFLYEAFVEQHLGRLVDASSHQRSFWYYVGSLPADFLPWSLFLPLALFYGHTHFGKLAERLLTCWVVVTFVALSLVSSKQGKYLLPMWTPLSVLMAAGLLERDRESLWERFLGTGLFRAAPLALKGVAAVCVVLAFGAATGFLPSMAGWFGVEESSPVFELLSTGAFRVKLAVLLVVLGAGLFFASSRVARELADRRLDRLVGWLAASTALGWLLVTVTYGDLNDVKSARAFCDVVRSRVLEKDELAIYGRPRGSIVYYLDRPLRVIEQVDPSGVVENPEAELESYLARAGTYLLVIDRDLERLVGYYPKIEKLCKEVTSGMVGSRRRYLLVRGVKPSPSPRPRPRASSAQSASPRGK